MDPEPAGGGEQERQERTAGGAGGSIADRFRLGRLLKQGNGVSTYLAEDLLSGATVVVKTVSSDAVSTAVQLRLQHEALVLERLGAATPGLRPLVASGHEGGLFYLVQPVVPGVTLAERLAEGPLPVTATLSVAIDVLRALEVAHAEGVLHRDVKPANVIVQPGQPEGTSVLVDFGLARSAGLDPSLEGDSVGTARYVAPEAAGLLAAEVDQRSDLYSLGVLLFECLTGRPPFAGTTVGQVLRQHLSLAPPQLRSLGLRIPRALDAVIQHLLAKEPADRYQSAAAVLADLEEISQALANGNPEPAVTPGMHDRRQVVTEPAFVGRAEELRTLTAAVDRARAGEGTLVLVEAESGGGKTRLLDELAIEAAQKGVWVLRGQALHQAALRPFQLLDGVVNEVVRAAARDPLLAGRLQRVLGDLGDAVAAAVPPLAAVLGSGDGSGLGPEAFGEARSLDALAALLDALGSPDRPALVLLDDGQWADGAVTRLLARWQSGAATPLRNVVVVVAFRSEEVDGTHPLRVLAPSATVRLGSFEEADIAALCESMAGPLPAEALATVIRLADGVPFMGSAVLRGMVESGAVRPSSSGWQIDPDALGEVQTSRRAALVLLHRFELLSPAALRLLEVGAVLGKSFELGLAVELTRQAPPEVAKALDEARRRRILWVHEETSTCSFTHDKLRDTLLSRLPATDLKALHRRAAERIEAADPDRVFELAYHFDAAGEPARTLPYAMEAAARARSRHALDTAVSLFRMARTACEQDPDADPACCAAISEGLAHVLALQGGYAEAKELLEQALSLTTESTKRAALDGKLGDLAFKRGDQVGARRHLERSLRDLGRWVPRSGLAFFVAAMWEVAVQATHTLFPRRFLGRRPIKGNDRDFLAMRMYSRLAYVYWFHAGKMPCAWSHLREMNLAERYPPTPELAQAYSEHAPVMTMAPWASRGIAYAQRSYEIRRELGDVWGQGQSLGFLGVVLYAASRYHEAIEKCEEAVRLLRRTGDRWEEHTAAWHIAFARYRLGDLGAAVETARRVHETATAIGDQAAAGISLSVSAKASAGRVPADLIAAELKRDNEDAHTTTEILVADGIRLLHAGDTEGAVARLDEARELVRRSGLRQEYVAGVWPWLATAQRTQLEQAGGHARRSMVRTAARSARRADWLSRCYRNNRPHALRERGLVAGLQGQPFRARSLLAKSLEVAEEQGARYEAALSRLAAARVALAAGRLGPGVDIHELAEAVAALEATVVLPGDAPPAVPASLSLADRFESILAVGRQIASAPSPAAVYRTVRDASLTLLRGDRCHVVLVGDGTAGPVTESGERIDQASRSLLERAIAGRAPVTTADADAVDPSESLLLSDLRSVLCAPILCDDEVIACLYTTHHQIGGLFGETEIKLAAFVATLAGAALEHMAGSEARFRSLAQNSSDVITIVNAAGIVTYQSSSVGRVFGYPADQMVGSDVRDWVHPDDLHQLVQLLSDPAPAAAGASPRLDMRLRHRDGTWRHAETAVTSMFDDPSVRGLVLNTRDVSERVALEAELRAQALQDPLTGLANRKLFSDRLDNALARSERDRHPVAVAFLDIDDFKSINDTLGHAAGDVLLREVGQRLLVCVRPGDTVARLGGDEFALLLEGPGAEAVEAVGQRVMHELGRPFRLLDQEVLVRASVGLAVARGDETTEGLLTGADTAMYVAKARGKSRFEVFRTRMRDDALERSGLRTDLEWALPHDELSLHYQPVMDVPSGTVRGFEALVRWNHPLRGELQPGEFIDLAEESGLILSIGAWVLRQACLQAQAWRRTYDGRLAMAVNVSARQLQDPHLVNAVDSALRASGLDPSGLVLEITESATVSDTEAAIARLEELKALGVGLAIDDFGTGYSSLSYLRRFPVDQLKVDRSFVAGLTTSSQDRAIVASVISLGHALGIQVVAEGVETTDQLAALGELGCDLAQGYNWDQPAPPDVVGAHLGERLHDLLKA